jgi:hypothetical protein
MHRTRIPVRTSRETTLRSIEPTSLNASSTPLVNSLIGSEMSLEGTHDDKGTMVYNVVQTIMPQLAAVGIAPYFIGRNISTFLEEWDDFIED